MTNPTQNRCCVNCLQRGPSCNCNVCVQVRGKINDDGCYNLDCVCHQLANPTQNQIMNDKKFDKVKDNYCPRCYFEDDKLVERIMCPHQSTNPMQKPENIVSDLRPFKHGEEGSHSCCNKRLEQQGGNARCCECVPHKDCENAMQKPQQTMQEDIGHLHCYNLIKDWEKRFDELFLPEVGSQEFQFERHARRKDFIRQLLRLLASQKDQIREITKGMKKEAKFPEVWQTNIDGYNQALEDLKSKLKEL